MTRNAMRCAARCRREVPLRYRGSLTVAISAVVSIAISCAFPSEGKAVVIVRNFVPDGDKFPKSGINAGPPPATVAGGGNLEAIFNAAADWWEISVPGNHTVTLDFGWSPNQGRSWHLTKPSVKAELQTGRHKVESSSTTTAPAASLWMRRRT